MNKDLFGNTGNSPAPEPASSPAGRGNTSVRSAPLADRMRPNSLDELVGQEELLGPRGPLRLLLTDDALPSLLLWGPPGCGKTTVARLVAHHSQARFLEYSAVAVGAKELKGVMAEAAKFKRATGTQTILFLDEIHRFNRAQQDALLPWVERGDITLIGATTENPSFEVNSALISRTRLFVLKPLQPVHIRILLDRALEDDRGLSASGVRVSDEGLDLLARLSEGDARAALGLLESVAAVATTAQLPEVSAEQVIEIIQTRAARYDKAGEEHFNIISALHKSLRNSDVQASVYWLSRMLEGGEDPLYIARRLVRFASEDVGLAEPQALTQALAARDAVHFIGLPEGALALTQAVVYLALCPKSNALYRAWKSASKEVATGSNPPVPLHLCNAPTGLMKDLGYGRDYAYAHDHDDSITEMACLPDALRGAVFYRPGQRGFEKELAERLEKIRQWHQRRQRRRIQTEGKPEGES